MPALNAKTIFYKYKLGHVIGFSSIAFLMFAMYYSPKASAILQIIWAIILTLVSIPCFFIAAYRLVPNFLYKKRFYSFIFYIVFSVLGFAVSGTIIARLSQYLIIGLPFFSNGLLQIFNVVMWNNFIGIALGSALKIISDRFRMERRLHEVEKEKITTELNFLRSQVNPHFLFNVMNMIYFQINKENTDARKSVETMSDMLRYQLYECNSDTVGIAKEVAYIKNYVNIQALRMEKATDIQLVVDEKLKDFNIAPLFILPIVENAFKHVSHYKEAEKNKIMISLLLDENNNFTVHTSNTVDKTSTEKQLIDSGGLGVKNLKRRLELLYPGKYELNISEEDGVYTTLLKIKTE